MNQNLTIYEVAAMTSLSPTNVGLLASAGIIPSREHRGHRVMTKDDVIRWANGWAPKLQRLGALAE